MQELDLYLNRLQHLPPAPKVLPELLRLLDRDDVDSERVVQLVQYEPSLTASILRASNRVEHAGRSRVGNISEAVFRLGFNTVFQIVVATSVGKAMTPAQKGYGMEATELWNHAVTSAVAAKMVARKVGLDENMAFTAGLLHDLGKIVLSSALEAKYNDLVRAVLEFDRSLLEAEKELLGVHHAEIGGRLLARWNFPASLVLAVSWHHMPQGANPYQKLASTTYLGNLLAYALGRGYGHTAFAFRNRPEVLPNLGLKEDVLPELLIKTHENLDEIQALFATVA